MILHCISDFDYNELVFKLIFQNSRFQAALSVSPAGIPTIGYGFDLRDDRVLIPVFEALGFDVAAQQLKDAALEAERFYIDLIRSVFVAFDGKELAGNSTESLNNVVQSILAARLIDKRYPRCHHYKRSARFVFQDKAAVKLCIKALTKKFEKTVDRWLMAFDLELVNRNPRLFARKSTERTVLLSLAYQGIIGLKPNKTPLFPALGNTFLLDDRALAWYYLRYRAFCGDERPIQTVIQRYYESELFSLYDEGTSAANITITECKKIRSVYREYKEHMISHEKQFSASIPEANRHFGLAGDKAIQTLEQNLAIANRTITKAKKVQPPLAQKQTPAAGFPRANAFSPADKANNSSYLKTVFAG